MQIWYWERERECILSHAEICISCCCSCPENLKKATLEFSPLLQPLRLPFPSCVFLSFPLKDPPWPHLFSLPSHSSPSFRLLMSPFSWLAFSMSLHPSPFYLLLTLNSIFSLVSHQVSSPRTNGIKPLVLKMTVFVLPSSGRILKQSKCR